jgi:putative glutamine amidotransferase
MNDMPLVGVTGGLTRFPIAWWFIRYALRRAGAHSVRLTPESVPAFDSLDGVVISGGSDIDTSLYMPDSPERAPLDYERDQFEIEMLNCVLPTQKPVLGICRGAQLINVLMGGSLHVDLRKLRKHTSNRRTPLARKTLLIRPETKLSSILNVEKARINSLHHQAVDRLGDRLQVAGHDLDGIVQAIELPGERFLMGVQWHPEYLPMRPVQLRLFKSFVAAAKA